ncbi:nuclear transport factor 2 family protein [Lysobacter sp. P5_B9]
MKYLPLILACLVSCPAFVEAAPEPAGTTSAVAADEAATTQIPAVIEAFRTAIITRDQPAFERLFLHEHITWQPVTSDAALQRIRQKAPTAQKLKVDANRTPYSFIAGIVASKNSSEETFDNVKIDTDGDLASVVFDYAFLSNGKETNHGKEAWHLLRTQDGWKIASVVWSVNLKPAPAN